MKKKLAAWSLLCFLLCALMGVTAQAAWKNTSQGMMYTTNKSPGYYTGVAYHQGSQILFFQEGHHEDRLGQGE